MKLIKIKEDHFVVVDDSEIKEGDWLYSFDNELIVQANSGSANTINSKSLNGRGYGKITHSTQPLELLSENGLSGMGFSKIRPLNVFEVKELIGEVVVEKKSEKFIGCEYEDIEDNIDQIGYDSFIRGYNQAIEDNKDRKYTEENIEWAIVQAFLGGIERGNDFNEVKNKIIQSLQPKTEWEVEFVDGKLKLV